MKKQKQWVHFIGMVGVTMAPLAHMFKQMGWIVTGSDKGIFPPMSDYLKDREMEVELGFKMYHLEKSYYDKKGRKLYVDGSYPDLVVVGNYAGLSNPEYVFAKQKKLTIQSYPEVLKKYLIKSNSIVVCGTYGKTTSSALLSLIFEKAEKKPSFMIGGIPHNFKDGVKNTESKWSIVEGDEYISARFDKQSKFFHYDAEFVLLTAAAWEHTDIFKTKQEYIDNFKKFIASIHRNGLIVACRTGENVEEVLTAARCKVITYEHNSIDDQLAKADWFNLPHKEHKDMGELLIQKNRTDTMFTVQTELIGDHNRENIIGCSVLAYELGIAEEAIQKAVAAFKGIKRRLEVRFAEENIKVIDDHACSPPKVAGSLTALRDTFPDWHITIIFEPNVGNRTHKALPEFDTVFDAADEVIIPRLKPVKTKKGETRVSGQELVEYLENQEVNVVYKEDDDKLVEYVSSKDVGKHIICFMGSYGWRKMIEQVIEHFS